MVGVEDAGMRRAQDDEGREEKEAEGVIESRRTERGSIIAYVE